MSQATQTSTCPWCSSIVYVDTPLQMKLCDPCTTQQQTEIQAHQDYLSARKASVASDLQQAQDMSFVKARLALFQAVDFSGMTDDQIKSVLLTYKQKLDLYFQ